MFKKSPKWLYYNNSIINFDNVTCICKVDDRISIYFTGDDQPLKLAEGTTLDDIHYFLKHGKPRKEKKNG